MAPAQIMDHQTRKLVQESWTKVFENEKHAVDVFYSKLFALDPSIQYLFKGDLGEQKKRLMSMFNIAVRGLDKLDEMLPTIEDLGKRHSGYNVRDEHYATMGQALVFMIEHELGDACTPEIRAAWQEAYDRWSSAMRRGANGQ
jgi:hemoglobin-like flavoprotein